VSSAESCIAAFSWCDALRKMNTAIDHAHVCD
jgi:hypothetical protein